MNLVRATGRIGMVARTSKGAAFRLAVDDLLTLEVFVPKVMIVPSVPPGALVTEIGPLVRADRDWNPRIRANFFAVADWMSERQRVDPPRPTAKGHAVRQHLRHLRNGQVVAVRAHRRGDQSSRSG